MPAKISIIIPCYNAAEFIEQTLYSVFSQSCPADEIIVIDDGCTDNTKQIISGIKDPRLTYVTQKNMGVSAARNTGLAIASGDYILFLDADDLLEVDFLKERLVVLENNPSVLFACSVASLIDGKGLSLHKQCEPVCLNIEEEICTYKSGYCSCPSNYLIRKEFKTRGLRFEETLSNSADRFFLLKLSQFGKGQLTSRDSKLKYRIHEKSMSKNIHPKNIRDLMLFFHLAVQNKLVPEAYSTKFKLKTFRVCFSEALIIKNIPLAWRAIVSVLFNRQP